MARLTHRLEQEMKKERYERLCRTPGTPEHAARQRRLAERSREIERGELNAQRSLRRAVAATSLDEQRRVIDAVLRMQGHARS